MRVIDRRIPINFDRGRKGHVPVAIVLHIMQMTLPECDGRFCDPVPKVSTHYGVGKDGTIHQWVDERDTAWGNGIVQTPTWKLHRPGVNPNLRTISIEHEGESGEPWTEAMYAADVFLIRRAARRWNIPLDRDHLIGHCEIGGHKPFCPGPGLDFDRLLRMLT